jgi:hypothetical protein
MTQKLIKSIELETKQILNIHQLERIYIRIDSLFNQQELTQSEYESLLNTHRKQLKFVLDLNLLPDYEFITRQLDEQFSQGLVKVDPGEILAEEFEIIEAEAIELNRARVRYIQEIATFGFDRDRIRKNSRNPLKLLFEYFKKLWQSIG